MKKFEFNLEKLLNYKDQNLGVEMTALGVLYNQLHNEEKNLESLFRERIKSREKYDTAVKEKTTPATCKLCFDYIGYLGTCIKESEKKIELLEIQIDKQIDRVKVLKVETKSLETIKESRFEEYKYEEHKKEELLMDEFVSTAKVMKKSS
jgi:flagellar export protein FliJ